MNASRFLAGGLASCLLVTLAVTGPGCATPSPNTVGKTRTLSPDENDQLGGTFIESDDLRTISVRMAASLLSSPAVNRLPDGALIAVSPVRNSTRFLIDRDIFTLRLRAELNRAQPGRLRFLAQGAGQEVRREMLGERDQARWEAEATRVATLLLQALPERGSPARVAMVAPTTVLAGGLRAEAVMALVRAELLRQGAGRVQMVARDPSGRPIDAVLAERDLRRLDITSAVGAARLAGVDYFLGGELVSRGLRESEQADDGLDLGVFLLEGASGAIVGESRMAVQQRMTSGVESAALLLTGELRSLSKAAAGGDRSDYILMAFQLIDPASNQVVWEDLYETKKVSSASVLYR